MTTILLAMILYMVRIGLVGTAIGVLFIRTALFCKMRNGQLMVLGIVSTPMIVSLADYLLGFVFIGWSSWFYYLVPVVISGVWMLFHHNYKVALSAFSEIGQYAVKVIKRAGNWILLDLVIASGFVFLESLLYNNSCSFRRFLSAYVKPVLQSFNMLGIVAGIVFLTVIAASFVYVIMRMQKDGSLRINVFLSVFMILTGCGIFFGMSFNSRPDYDSDRSHYQLDARYFCEDKNSWEIDNYTDERYGSSIRDDHGPLWIMNLADAQMLADAAGLDDPVRVVNFAIFWTYCCFYIILFLTASFISGKYSTGIVSLLLFNLYQYEVLMIMGSRDAFRFVGLLLLYLYVSNILTEIIGRKARWHHYAFMALFCYLSINGHEGNVYVMLGMFIVVAVLLLANRTRLKELLLFGSAFFCGTLLGVSKTISIYLETGRIKSLTTLPFHDTPVIQQIAEINKKRADWETIWETYSRPVLFMMVLGITALIVMIAVSAVKKDKNLLIYGILIAGMLLPMTGTMDWIGYECSRWFAEQPRYRMYFLMLLAIMGGWMLTRQWTAKLLRYLCGFTAVIVFGLWLSAENNRVSDYNKGYLTRCITDIESYKELADTAASVTDGNVFTRNQVILYYLHGTPKLLDHIYTEDLIQAKTDTEIEAALEKLDVGAILLPGNGVDYHDYSLLPFWDYIHENENFGQIKNEKNGYVIFYRN
ncbi:MAG: hypothetical protein HDQ96_09690 [Lachnospiraceae bacterium]|nr:hypothetical protein [Lachnospiraceae bacterium]